MRNRGRVIVLLGALELVAAVAVLLVPRGVEVGLHDLNRALGPSSRRFVAGEGHVNCNVFGSTFPDDDFGDELCKIAGPNVLIQAVPIAGLGVVTLAAGVALLYARKNATGRGAAQR